MKRRVNAAIIAAALAVGMSTGTMTANAETLHGLSEDECKAAGGHIDMGVKDEAKGIFGACVVPDKPAEPEQPAATDEPAGPTKEPRPGLWQKPANTTEDGNHCLPGYKRDMSKWDINGHAGECVKAEAPAPKPSEPEKPKPSETDKPKPSETDKPGEDGKDGKPGKDGKDGKDGKCTSKCDEKKSDDKKKFDDKKTVAKAAESKKAAPTKKAETSSQKPAAQQQKSNGTLAKTGVSVGGLLLATVALTGGGIFLMRRRQNS